MQEGRHGRAGGLYTAAEARAIDARAIQQCGIEGYTLMQRAAAAALAALRARWAASRDLLVCCGSGNNGGDGYVLARDAARQGWRVRVLAVTDPTQLAGDAARAAKDCRAAGVPIFSLTELDLRLACSEADVIVDGLLGTGLRSAVREPLRTVIQAINESGRPVLALDVPSGLCADTGAVLGVAVQAHVTVTFIVEKLGLWLGQGPEYVGACQLASLALPEQAFVKSPAWSRLTAEALRGAWRPRHREAHKGDAGHVMVVGGGEGMPGAARLTAESALASGAGRVTVLCAPASSIAIAAGRPEVMVWAVEDPLRVQAQLAKADVIALGPGLGLTDWSRALFSLVISLKKPLVVDADALNLLAECDHEAMTDRAHDEAPCILTPHPGEAARLLGVDTPTIQRDRLAAVTELCTRYRATCVLKGAGTWLGDMKGQRALCVAGNPAMATAGMGDVLTGLIAALLAQGGSAWDAACTGVWLHATAADEWAVGQGVDRGLLAGQLASQWPRLWSRLLGMTPKAGFGP